MKVWEEKHELKLPQDGTRTPGLHVSDVIRDLALHSKVLDDKWVRVELEDQNTNLMQVGMGWEDYLAKYKHHPEIEYHPGELYVDCHNLCECGHFGEQHELDFTNVYMDCKLCSCVCYKGLRIYMSPDGVSLVDPEDYADVFAYATDFLHEFKFTKKSCREFAAGLRMGSKPTLMWMWQIKAYAYAMGTLAAKLHAMFVNGNYSYDMDDPESAPQYKIYRFQFTQDELDSNWRMLVAHAGYLLREGRYTCPVK
jgi:hypothetical protein